jgi:large repetitive protein
MDRRHSCTVFLGVLLAVMQFAACGGGSGTAPLVVYTTSIPKGFVNTPYYSTLQAVGGTVPYTWAQTSGGPMPPGLTLNSSGTFTGTPTQAGTFGPYVFTVTDSTSTTTSGTTTASTTASSTGLSITIAASTLSVTTASLPNGSIGTAYSVALMASGGSSPYSWSETTGGALPPGLSLASSGTISGTPTTAGTYGPYVFTVLDTKSTNAVSPSLMITITGTAVAVCTIAGNEGALTIGNPYAFLLKGTDSRGNPIDIAGSFTPDGEGGITAAVADYNGFTNGPEPLQVNLTGSSYSFSSSAQGCLYLAFSGLASADASVRSEGTAKLEPENGAQTRKTAKPELVAVPVSNVQFSFNLSGYDGTVYNTGRIIESDTSSSGTNASGFIHVQAPSAFTLASLQANYAFGVDGWTATAPGTLRTAMAGAFTNTAGVISAGFADVNAGGTASGEVTGGYGTLNATIDPTTGRGTGSYYLITPTGRLTFDFAFYVLNGSDLILLSTDLAQSSSTTPLLAGRAMVSTVNYNAAGLNGYYLLASEGLQTIGIATGNIAQIGTLNATSAGTIPTATIYSNYAGTYLTNQYPGSSYSVEAASGRVSITGLQQSPPVVYLTNLSADDGIAGFLVGIDVQASSGVIVTQTTAAPSYTVGSVSGSYAASTAEDVDGLNGSFLGAFSFAGTGSYTVTPQTTGKVTNVPSLGSIVVNSDGSGNLDGGNFPLVTNGTVLFAIPNSGDPLLFVLTEGTMAP